MAGKKKKEKSPPGIYIFTTADNTHGVLVLEHIACVRWDGNQVPALYVYFASSVPHVKLEEAQGVELVKLLAERDEYSRAILQL